MHKRPGRGSPVHAGHGHGHGHDHDHGHEVPLAAVAARVVAGVAGVGLAAWEGTLFRASSGSEAGVLAVIGIAFTTALVAGRHRQRATAAQLVRHGADLLGGRRRLLPTELAGAAAWALLVAATVAWDLYSFARQRHDLPTFSRLCGDVTAQQWGRALFFALWLALGAVLALGWRAPATTSPSTRRHDGGAR